MEKGRRLSRLRKKGRFQTKISKSIPQGLKPLSILLAYLSGLKTPTYQSRPTARTSFSAVCKAGFKKEMLFRGLKAPAPSAALSTG
jgi:hypothetical protein